MFLKSKKRDVFFFYLDKIEKIDEKENFLFFGNLRFYFLYLMMLFSVENESFIF